MQDQIEGRLAVRFYKREVENEYMTTKEGRPIKYMADFVRIEVPGDMTTVIDTFVNEEHKKRFPQQWYQFKNEQDESALGDVQGTLLKDWPLLTAAQASEMRHFKFYTIEQVANASDQQISTLGMLVGMQPFALREKAKAFLAQAKDSSVVQQQAEEIKKRDQQIADLQAQMTRLMEAMKKDDEPKRGPGRPKKDE